MIDKPSGAAAHWSPAGEGHPLGRIQGMPVDGLRLQVLLGQRNRFGADYFQLWLHDRGGRPSQEPAVVGMVARGSQPAHNWIEVMAWYPWASFLAQAGEVRRRRLVDTRLEEALMRCLAATIPPGGHLMVEYESPERRETERALALGIPPVATPLGSLFFLAGCGASIRDWYIAEGGLEGPRKLQGFRALNEEHARTAAAKMVSDLEGFLARKLDPSHQRLLRRAQRRARKVLDALQPAVTFGA